MEAWHFLSGDKRLRFGTPTIVEVGKTLKATGPLGLCENGMHASIRLIDALQYAPGPVLCRVKLAGKIVEGGDKVCARSRTVIAMVDASPILHEFACWTALEALKSEQTCGRTPDPRSFAAIETKRKWLRGEATDAELDAARSAAWSAARSAARSAAWSAARAAARSAAESAARSAARSAAESAAWSAAESAAWSAAESAAWSAAWSAARSAQNEKLEAMAYELLGLAALQ